MDTPPKADDTVKREMTPLGPQETEEGRGTDEKTLPLVPGAGSQLYATTSVGTFDG
jgi:hypothetical protein